MDRTMDAIGNKDLITLGIKSGHVDNDTKHYRIDEF
jgi:hypothetical protein